MALSLGVHPRDKIYVDETPVEVLEIHGYTFALLKVNGSVIKVDDQRAVEVLPDVMVSCGRPSMMQINKQAERVRAAHAEWDKRLRDLKSGKLSKEQYDLLPKVEMPPGLLPRLLFDAPDHITILREDLYRAGRRSVAHARQTA
jgi:hypothetical protein